jgi:hypothetical protein
VCELKFMLCWHRLGNYYTLLEIVSVGVLLMLSEFPFDTAYGNCVSDVVDEEFALCTTCLIIWTLLSWANHALNLFRVSREMLF